MDRQNRAARDGGDRTNLYDEITAKIINELEQGAVGPGSSPGAISLPGAPRTALNPRGQASWPSHGRRSAPERSKGQHHVPAVSTNAHRFA